MRNIKLTLSYVGTRYHGWQKQPDTPTVQGTLERAILELTGENVKVNGASRTDAGVHALGQVANFMTLSKIDDLKGAINSKLPDDIRVVEWEDVDITFDARRDSKSKLYRYLMLLGDRNPLLDRLALCVPYELDIKAMQKASEYLVGKHNFLSFSDDPGSPVREVHSVELQTFESPWRARLLAFEILADSFLRYMVRNIVGFLLEVGRGKMSPEEFGELIIKPKETTKTTAPPHGLYLVEVNY